MDVKYIVVNAKLLKRIIQIPIKGLVDLKVSQEEAYRFLLEGANFLVQK